MDREFNIDEVLEFIIDFAGYTNLYRLKARRFSIGEIRALGITKMSWETLESPKMGLRPRAYPHMYWKGNQKYQRGISTELNGRLHRRSERTDSLAADEQRLGQSL